MKGRTFLGAVVVLVGCLLLLSRTGIYSFGSLISDWWPMILIIVGAYSLAVNTAPTIGGIALVFIGLWFQLGKFDFMPGDWNRYLFPAVIIIVGLYFMFSRREKTVADTDIVNHLAIFSGIDTKNESKGFKGGSITALFGGVDLDLTSAVIESSRADLDVTAAFGGADIIVPRGWRVEMTGLPLFGGWSNKTKVYEKDEGAPFLHVRCLAMFGGIEIKAR